MTMELLEQFADLQREYRRLTKDIEFMSGSAERVRGSMTDHPYVEINIPVVTYPSQRTLDLMQSRRQELSQKLESIHEFINSVDDSKARQIIDLRIIKGRTWLQTAFATGWTDEQRPRKYLKYYINRRYGRNGRKKAVKMVM